MERGHSSYNGKVTLQVWQRKRVSVHIVARREGIGREGRWEC